MPGVSANFPPALSVRLAYGEPNGPYCNHRMRVVRRNLRIGLAAAVAVALLGAGCGSSSGGDYGGQHPDYARALAGSPAPLAALHRQADRLLPGGEEAYEARLAKLRGYPAVVNVWASWCGPCRFEFPLFQHVAASLGKRVAFLGIDSEDDEAAARTFLGEAPVPYPSYVDPDKSIAESVGAKLGFPDTAFYDRGGELVYLKQGPFHDQAELRADIERYALRGERESG
jgi:cytochrome c biogenesis protein CcmG, thiol:disulfide interchange protein DsbE